MAPISHISPRGISGAAMESEHKREATDPEVDIRVVPMTVADGQLQVAVVDPDGRRRLPRGMPLRSRSLDAQASMIVRDALAVPERYLEQLFTLSVVDEAGWRVIVSYLALVNPGSGESSPEQCLWQRCAEVPPLARDDQMVLDYAIVRLRAKIGYSAIAFHLLPADFTLPELQAAYEAILGRSLDKRNFRRRIIAAELIEATNEKRRDGSHRPAVLYRFRSDHDPSAYLTPAWNLEEGASASSAKEQGR